MFTLLGGFPGTENATELSQGLSAGGKVGTAWTNFALPLTGALEPVEEGGGDRVVGGFLRMSPNLTCGFESSTLAQPAHPGELTPLLPEGEKVGEQAYNLYRWERSDNTMSLATELMPHNTKLIRPLGTYSWAVNGMSSNCNRVAFEFNETHYELPLNRSRTEFAPYPSIEEWSSTGGEKLASYVPTNGGSEEVPATGVKPLHGGFLGNNFNEVSSDGSSLFFTADGMEPGVELEEGGKVLNEDNHEQVFDRYEAQRTIQVSRSQTTIPDTGAVFQGASEDGTSRLLHGKLRPGGKFEHWLVHETVCAEQRRGATFTNTGSRRVTRAKARSRTSRR